MADDAKTAICEGGMLLSYEDLAERCISLNDALTRLGEKNMDESQKNIHLRNENEHLMRQLETLSKTNQMLTVTIERLTRAGSWDVSEEASNG